MISARDRVRPSLGPLLWYTFSAALAAEPSIAVDKLFDIEISREIQLLSSRASLHSEPCVYQQPYC